MRRRMPEPFLFLGIKLVNDFKLLVGIVLPAGATQQDPELVVGFD